MKRNPYLRVKLKSLAEEARIIRLEEQRANQHRDFQLQNNLREHRIGKVRTAARETLLAYQYLRGKSYLSCESINSIPPNWKNVETMVRRYGDWQIKFDSTEWVNGNLLKAA